MPDLVLGQYRVTGVLGEGGMGVVYAAEHTLLGRTAAVKVLLPELSSKQDVVKRFFNEARAATAIRHPGIVEIYDFGWTPEGAAFIVMEHLQGETLRARARHGPVSWSSALAITRQIAGALGAAHAKGIVHRDLKPDNVFLVPDPEVPGGERIKLLDFGIAKLVGSSVERNMTRTGSVIGTPTYMAPEQCRGVAVDSRADLYSLGCILFELCSGRPPFEGEGEGDVLAAHIHVPVPKLGSRVKGVPPELEALVQRLLAKPPLERAQTAEEVIRLVDAASNVVGGPRTVNAFPHEPSVSASAMRYEPPAASGPRRAAASGPQPALASGPRPVAASGPQPAPQASPAAHSSVPPGTIYSETTLSSAVSSHRLPAPKRASRRGLLIASAAGLALVAGIVAIVVSSGGDDMPQDGSGTAPASAVAANTAEPDAPPAPPPSPPPIEKAPPPPPDPTPATPTITSPADKLPEPTPPAAEPPKPEPPKPAPQKSEPPKPEPEPKPVTPPKTVAKQLTTHAAAPPPPTHVDVIITSNPSDADVVRDGNVIGKTPLRTKMLRTNRDIRLVLRRQGHQDQPITVHTGGAINRNVKLSPVAHDKGVNPFK